MTGQSVRHQFERGWTLVNNAQSPGKVLRQTHAFASCWIKAAACSIAAGICRGGALDHLVRRHDRKSVVEGKSVSGRDDPGGSRSLIKTTQQKPPHTSQHTT